MTSRRRVGTESEIVPAQPTARVLTPYGIDGARTGRHPARRRCGATRRASSSAPRQSTSSGRCGPDRKSTRLNSSHLGISYAVFCLKKKNKKKIRKKQL